MYWCLTKVKAMITQTDIVENNTYDTTSSC